MNNKEYQTLLQGLAAVVGRYKEVPYGWVPVTTEPAYLHLEQPDIDFVALARAFGVAGGRRIARPEEVKGALKEGLEYVLGKKQAFVVELSAERNPATAAPTILPQGPNSSLTLSGSIMPPRVAGGAGGQRESGCREDRAALS